MHMSQVKSGDIWEGIFTCLKLDDDSTSYKVVLGYPKKRLTPGSKDKDDLAVRPEEYKIFEADELVMVTAKEVRISEQEVAGGDEFTGGAGGFETDAAIGKGHASG